MQTQVVYVISTLKHHQAQNSRFYANIPVLYMSSELNILFKSGTLREWSLNLIQQELIKDGRSRFSSWPINWNSTNKNRYFHRLNCENKHLPNITLSHTEICKFKWCKINNIVKWQWIYSTFESRKYEFSYMEDRRMTMIGH